MNQQLTQEEIMRLGDQPMGSVGQAPDKSPADKLVNLPAEQAVLAALLANNEAWYPIADRLAPEHFSDALHGRVYEAISRLLSRGQAASVITLKNLFDQDGALANIGGVKYLIDLAQGVVTVRDAPDYADAVIDLFRRRKLIGVLEEAADQAATFDPERDAADMIERAEAALAGIMETSPARRPVITAADAMMMAIEQADQARRSETGAAGLSTGIKDLDRKLGGLHRSNLVVLAARPSMGKSALMGTIALNVAEAGHSTAIFSLEMSALELGQRFIAGKTGVDVERQRRGGVGDADIERMMEWKNDLAGLPLRIEDDPTVNAHRILSRARRLQRRHGLDLVLIDYLQIIRPPQGSKKGLYEATTETSAACKMLARQLDVPVILLSQLSREVEKRDDKRPMLSDLRDSGAIEQDADVVLFLYRDQYYAERSEPKQDGEADAKFQRRHADWQNRIDEVRGKAEIIIGKQRHGSAGTVTVAWDGARQRFSDLQREE